MKSLIDTTSAKRARRHARVRARVRGTASRPRLAFYKSNKFISAQIIDDEKGVTLAAAHGRECKGALGAQAAAVGAAIAKRAIEKGIKAAVFDRGGFPYAAQVKALADAARAEGLAF